MRKVSVAVPVPFLDLLTYNVPDGLTLPPIGGRVRVPVGSRVLTGCVVEYPSEPGADELKDIIDVVDNDPLLLPDVVALCRWVADYYLAGVGDAMAAAMPPGARRQATSFKTKRVAAATALALDPASRAAARRLTAKQQEALEVLSASATGLPLSELRDRGISSDVIGRLASQGLVALRGVRLRLMTHLDRATQREEARWRCPTAPRALRSVWGSDPLIRIDSRGLTPKL